MSVSIRMGVVFWGGCADGPPSGRRTSRNHLLEALRHSTTLTMSVSSRCFLRSAFIGYAVTGGSDVLAALESESGMGSHSVQSSSMSGRSGTDGVGCVR